MTITKTEETVVNVQGLPPAVKENLPKPMPKSAGRPKGSKNRIGQKLKEAIEASFDEIGGVEYLCELARDEPKAYANLLAKCIPAEVTGKDGRDLIPEGAVKKAVLVVPAVMTSDAWSKAVKEAITK